MMERSRDALYIYGHSRVFGGGGQGGEIPGQKGAGVEGMGSRIPKVADGERGENYTTLCNVSQSKKREPTQIGGNRD